MCAMKAKNQARWVARMLTSPERHHPSVEGGPATCGIEGALHDSSDCTEESMSGVLEGR